jgi:hypothetical protein
MIVQSNLNLMFIIASIFTSTAQQQGCQMLLFVADNTANKLVEVSHASPPYNVQCQSVSLNFCSSCVDVFSVLAIDAVSSPQTVNKAVVSIQ